MGVSLLAPNLCFQDALEMAQVEIDLANRRTLNPRGLQMKLRLAYSTSWLELAHLTTSEISSGVGKIGRKSCHRKTVSF